MYYFYLRRTEKTKEFEPGFGNYNDIIFQECRIIHFLSTPPVAQNMDSARQVTFSDITHCIMHVQKARAVTQLPVNASRSVYHHNPIFPKRHILPIYVAHEEVGSRNIYSCSWLHAVCTLALNQQLRICIKDRAFENSL